MTVGRIMELLIDRYDGRDGCHGDLILQVLDPPIVVGGRAHRFILRFVRDDDTHLGSIHAGILLSRDQAESIMGLVDRYEPGPAPPRTRYRGLEIEPGDQAKSGVAGEP